MKSELSRTLRRAKNSTETSPALHKTIHVVGWAGLGVLALVAVLGASMVPDLVRYMKIRSM